MPVATPDRDLGRSRRHPRHVRPPATRKAPAVAPGPYRDSERKRVARYRTTPSYQRSIRVARQHGPVTRRGTRRPGGDDKSAADRARAVTYVQNLYAGHRGFMADPKTGKYVRVPANTTVPPDVAGRTGFRQQYNAELARVAPIVSVLDNLTRPLHGVAAGTRSSIADIKAHGITLHRNPDLRKAFVRGLKNEDRSTFSDVLGDLGVENPIARAVGGFLLDIPADPTTIATFGGSTAAKQAALSAGRHEAARAITSDAAKNAATQASEQALRHGATPKQAVAAGKTAARTHAVRAGKRAATKATQGKATNTGLDVRLAGRSIPGVTRATAATRRVPRRVASKTGLDATRVGQKVDRAQQGVRDAVRSTASEFNPNITPVGIDKAQYQSLRRSARTARAGRQRGDVYAALHAQSFVDRVGAKNFQQVIYAIEEGTTKQLPKGLRAEAARFTASMRKMLKEEQRSGIKVGDRTKVGDVVDYVKQLRIEENAPRRATVGARKVAPDYAKARREGTIREKNTAEPGSVSEDLGQIVAQRTSQHSRSVAAARLNQAIGRAGRKLDGAGDLRGQLKAGESVYRVDGPDLIRLDVGKAKDRNLIDSTGRSRYVVLNDKAIERTAGTVFPAGERTTPGVFFDKAQGVWKIGATVVNPGYYVRNFIGEAQNAYLKENPARLAKNVTVSARALREVRKREEAKRKGARYEPGKHGPLIDKAEDVGAVRAGQYAREVGQLISGESKKHGAKVKGAGPLRRAARFRDNIEDAFRLATFKGGLDRGLKPEKAVERAARNHFDYGDLTPTERIVMRRVMPFYTFSSRNIPLQIVTLLKRPGKFAQYAKLREEFAKAFGFQPGWEQQTSDVEQRSAAIPVKWKGIGFTLSLGPSGLPLTDLNELPVTGNPADTASEWMARAASMVTPAIKSPVEMWANFSFFFRDQLERDTSPLVPAPSWAQHLPNAVKKMTGLVPDYYDRRTGKYTWGWRAKADYIINQVPGPAAFASRLSKSSSRASQSDALQTLAYLGPRVRPIDTAAATVNNLYDERDQIVKQQAMLRQRNIKTGRVPESARKTFLELKKRARVVDFQIRQLQTQIEAMPTHPDPGASSLQDEILKRMTAPAPKASGSALEDEVRRRLGG